MWLLLRELIGWLLVAAGLAMIGVMIHLAVNRAVLEAIAISLPAAIVFRAGIGFVRLAVAGRIASRIVTEETDRAAM